MLPEIGMSELVVIAIVALIVVGPKDLPVLLRRFGQFMAKLRGMAAEFRASFDEMARQSELDELRKEVEAMRRGQFADIAEHDRQMRETVNDIEQSMADVGVQLHPPMSHQYDLPPPEAEVPPLQIGEGEPPAPRKPRVRRPKTAAEARETSEPVPSRRRRKPAEAAS